MNEQSQSSEVEVKPLTNWKNEPTVLALKQDLTDAKPIHDTQKVKIGEWLDNLNVTGNAKIKTPKGNSSIVPKLIRKQAEWRYAALSEPFLSTDDLFNCRPVTWEDREAAIQNELVLNKQFNVDLDKTKFVDDFVRTAVDEGTVLIRTGWEFDEEEYEATVPEVEFVVNPELAPMYEQLDQMKEQSPSQYATDVPEEMKQAHEMSLERGVAIEAQIVGQKTETRTRVLYNRPTAEVWPYQNVILDPTCKGDVDKASFAVFSFESNKAQLEKDGKYKNLDKIVLAGSSILNEPDHAANDSTKSFNFNDEPRKKFVVFEYWGLWDINKDGKLVPIVAAWVGQTLIRLEENPYPDKKIPLVLVQYLPVRREIYGEPDGALLEDNQKILGAVTRGMIDVMGKSANGQTGMRKDMLDVTNKRKYERGEDYEFNPTVDPRLGVYMHTFPEIPQSAQFMVQLVNMEAESLTGVKAYSQGVSGATLGDVAAGVRGALDAASKRELGILRRLSAGIVKIGRKFMSMNAEFLSEKEVVRITNDDFVTVRKDDLAGNFDLRLSISTAEEDNNKAEQLAFLLQTLGNTSDPGLTKMILSDIAKLRKMPDMAKKIEDFEPQPDPIQQQIAQLQVELLKAQIAETNAKAMSYQPKAQLDMAKANTEVAKAENLSAATDLTNLDFVEQESGVKQERDKELHGEQARAQGQLKMLEHGIQQQENAKDRQFDLVKEHIKARAKKKAA